jgi:hypothetical protein
MVTTILAVVALVGSGASAKKPAVAWHTDYQHALDSASVERKPMAVFVGQGAERLARMMEDGTIPDEAIKVLRENYVVICLEATTGAGQELASRYAMSEGLVINDARGSVLAVRVGGAVAGQGLTAELLRYSSAPSATPTASPATPASVSRPATPSYAVVAVTNCPNGYCPNGAATAYAVPLSTAYRTVPAVPTASAVAPPAVASSYGTSSGYRVPTLSYPFAMPTSSCPNGRCPNSR